MNFTLRVGLTLRHGQRTLELTRVLNDDEVQLEDVLTRRARTLKVSELIKKVWNKEYQVVLGTTEVRARGASAKGEVTDTPASVLIDWSKLPAAWIAQVEYRMRYLKGLQAAHVSRGDRRARGGCRPKRGQRSTGDSRPPSASTVMNWARRYQLAECNPLALVDFNKTRTRTRRLPEEVEALVRRVLKRDYFTRSRNSLRHAHHCVQRELKHAVRNGEIHTEQGQVSYRTVVRRVQGVDAYQRIASREGEARARMVCRTAMGGDPVQYPMQRVEVDHTPLNWVAICDRTGLPLGRPLLTLCIDSYSGYVSGLYLSFYGPGVTSVAGALRNAMAIKSDLLQDMNLRHPWLAHGMPDELTLDNGLEFHARAFMGMCWELGVDITYCRVRTPWLKPHVERFFATLNHLTLAPGRIHKRIANVMNVDPYKDAAIRFSDLVRGLVEFVVDVYPFQIHERKLARPFDLFSEGLERCPPAVFPGDADRLKLVAGMSKTLTVAQGGVELLGLPYGGPELLAWRKRYGRSFKAMCKWDPDDMSQIYVQDPDQPTVLAHQPLPLDGLRQWTLLEPAPGDPQIRPGRAAHQGGLRRPGGRAHEAA